MRGKRMHSLRRGGPGGCRHPRWALFRLPATLRRSAGMAARGRVPLRARVFASPALRVGAAKRPLQYAEAAIPGSS